MKTTLAELVLHKIDFVPSSASRGRRVFRCYDRRSKRLISPEIGAAILRVGGVKDVRVEARAGTLSTPQAVTKRAAKPSGTL